LGIKIKDNIWKGHRAFIIGGGPSLKGFDWKLLRNEKTIGINKAIIAFEPDVLFSMDKLFWSVVYPNLGIIPRCTKIYLDGNIIPKCSPKITKLGIIKYLRYKESPKFSKSLKDGLSSEVDSGYAALNLALLLGADPIYLLGYDMKLNKNSEQIWWHDGYKKYFLKNAIENYKKRIFAYEKYAKPIIDDYFKVKVINLNINSNIKCFPFAKREEIFEKS